MKFTGRVYRRSSADPPKQFPVAGESKVFECNPQRVWRIKKETGWAGVFFGTLNLCVSVSVSRDLTAVPALFFERPEDIEHPTNPDIPGIRGGYCYYSAMASVGDKSQEVLVRRACCPHDLSCLELVAPVKLIDCFEVDEGDEIKVTLSFSGQ